AAWDKSGIFLSKDNYLSLVNDNQSLKNRIEELQITVRTQEEMREKDRRVIEAYKTSQRSMALDFEAKTEEFKAVQTSFSQSAQVLMNTFMEDKVKELADGQKYVEDNLN
ncbi:2272_t:CDS:2, partial [Paraglomus occultum]